MFISLSSLKARLSANQYLLSVATLAGLISGLAAVAVKTAVYLIHHYLKTESTATLLQYIYLLFPLCGILLTVAFIKYFLKNKFGKGSAHVLFTIARNSSNIERHMTFSHLITSALTVGFGGSAGLEAPIVVTGSAIGSNLGRLFKFNYRERTILLAAGAAAGIAAVFNAPIAGFMFAIEVLIVDLSLSSFIPLIIASATGALLSKMILNEHILFFFTLKQPFNYLNVPYYFGLGICTGLVSIYYIRAFTLIERFFKKFREHIVLKALAGGISLGLLILIFPPLFGEGYQSIKYLANETPQMLLSNNLFSGILQNQWVFIGFIFFVGLLKVISASLTIGSGGNGGNFAPSLFVGAFIGYAYAKFLNDLFHLNIPVGNFTIVGMAGILCGVMHAPLTSIFLIAEITGGYELMIPLMIVASLTFVLVRHFEPYSLDKKELARKGDLLTENRDKNILSLLDLSELIEKDYTPVPKDTTLAELTTIISSSKRNIYPVIDNDNKLLGIITLDEIRNMLFELEEYSEILAVELMSKPAALVKEQEPLDKIMQKFETTKKWNLPVVREGVYIGFVSKSGILARYREHLRQNFSGE